MNSRGNLLVALGATALSVLLLLGYLIWSGYRTEIHDAETMTRNYAAVLETRLDATLRRADAELQELTREIPVAALNRQAVPRYARELNSILKFGLTDFPELENLRIFDANGEVLYYSDDKPVPRTNISDRRHFRQVRDDGRPNLVFSEVVISRITGRPGIFAVRGLRDGQGVFRGMVIAAINLEYFQKLFQALNVGAGGNVAIYRSDDFTRVLRWPAGDGKSNVQLPLDTPTRKALASGNRTVTFEIPSAADGVVRIYSCNVLDAYPFFVSVGVAHDDVLADWKARSLAVGLSGLLLVGLLAGLLHRLLRTEDALKANEERMRRTFEQAAVGIAHVAVDTSRILLANDTFCRLLGYAPSELAGVDSRGFARPDELPERMAERAKILAGEVQTSACERRMIRKDGSLLWVLRSLSLVRDAAGKPQYFITVIKDISERKVAEEALSRSEARFRSLTHLSSDNYWEQDDQYCFTLFSGTGSQGISEFGRDILGKKRWEQDYVNMSALDWAAHVATLDARQPFHDLELCWRDASGRKVWFSVSGEPVFDAAGIFKGYRGVGKDITERKEGEEHIHYLANHDALTSLPNRAMFSDVLGLALRNARRTSRALAVLFIDLDRFKIINDTLGHEAGDQLLQEIGRRLMQTVRANDVVARLGGDEFVVLVQEAGEPRQVEEVARKILAAVIKPMTILGQQCGVTASIGICLYPADAGDEQALMKNADISMYRAKEAGKNTYRFYAGQAA